MHRKVMVLAVGAALAAPSAYSQTSDKWEIYGKFYPEWTHQSGTGPTAAGSTVSELSAAATGTRGITSRWEMQISNTYLGFRGQRDLGGGLKAIGQLEQQVAIDEGAPPNIGNRDSFAGVAASWGTVRLGNMDTPFKKYGDVLGFLGVSSGNFVTANNIMRKVGFGDNSAASFNLRRANAIDFASQNFGGLQIGVQYSIGNPTEAGINGAGRFPRVISLGVKWEQGPLYLAIANETHYDLFGGSLSVAGPPAATVATSNAGNLSANSKDTATQVTAVYKIDVHSFELDANMKKYSETGQTAANTFQEYKNTAYEAVWEARWTNQWRTALSYAKATAGSCSLFNPTTTGGCGTGGLDGNLLAAGVAYYLDPSFYIFGLYSKLTNGSSARFNNNGSTTKQTPNAGEDVTQAAVGIAYSF